LFFADTLVVTSLARYNLILATIFDPSNRKEDRHGRGTILFLFIFKKVRAEKGD
jgi:hypothetical protein